MLSTLPRELRRAAGLSVPSAAAYLDVSTRTLRRWENEDIAPRWALDRLHQRAHGLPIDAGRHWSGWRFYRGYLMSPEGDEFTPATLRAWRFERQMIASAKRRFSRFFREPQQIELWPGVDFDRPRAGR